MDLLHNNLVNYSFMAILLSMVLYWSSVAFPKVQLLLQMARIGLGTSNIILCIIITERWIDTRHFPLSNLYESLLFLTWCTTFINLLLEFRTKNSLTGSLITPLATFILAFASLVLPTNMQKATSLVPALQSNWLVMHVSIIMASYAVLIVGTLLAILFLAVNQLDMLPKDNTTQYTEGHITTQFSALYTKQKLQLLEDLDNLSYRTIGLGFPLLTIGIISGAVWANEAWGSYWSWDPKETWALITWLVFASYLHVRINRNWKGQKASILAAIGFVVVWICYLGVNFLGQGLHSYGWIQ